MTVISSVIEDVAGNNRTRSIWIRARELRANGTALVDTTRFEVRPNSSGVFTTPDLAPGPAQVIVDSKTVTITIPNSGPVTWYSVLSAGIGVPPGTPADAIAAAVTAYLAANPPSGGGSSLTITDNNDGTLTLNDGGSGALVDNNDGTFTLTV
jgi:hypothetical protein